MAAELLAPFRRLDLDTVDASGTTTYNGQARKLGALSARGFKALRRMQGADIASPQYEADEAIVLGEIFRGWDAEEVAGMSFAQQSYAVSCAWKASDAALARAIAATFGGPEGNGEGPAADAPARSTASPTST